MQRSPINEAGIARQPRAVLPGIECGQDLDSTEQQPDAFGDDQTRPHRRCAADAVVAGVAQIATGSCGIFMGSQQKNGVRKFGREREPDVLRIAQQQLRAGQQGNECTGQGDSLAT